MAPEEVLHSVVEGIIMRDLGSLMMLYEPNLLGEERERSIHRISIPRAIQVFQGSETKKGHYGKYHSIEIDMIDYST
jgi:hypothetical protein